MEQRRQAERREYKVNCIVITKFNFKEIHGTTKDVSSLGIAVIISDEEPALVGKEVIVVTETFITLAEVVREVSNKDCTRLLGMRAKDCSYNTLKELADNLLKEDN